MIKKKFKFSQYCAVTLVHLCLFLYSLCRWYARENENLYNYGRKVPKSSVSKTIAIEFLNWLVKFNLLHCYDHVCFTWDALIIHILRTTKHLNSFDPDPVPDVLLKRNFNKT